MEACETEELTDSVSKIEMFLGRKLRDLCLDDDAVSPEVQQFPIFLMTSLTNSSCWIKSILPK